MNLQFYPRHFTHCAVLKIDIVTVHLPCDLVKFCVLVKGFVWATWGSDMEIIYKIRNEFFLLARKNWNLYHFLDPRYFTLDPRHSTFDPRQKTYTRKKFIDVYISNQAFYARVLCNRIRAPEESNSSLHFSSFEIRAFLSLILRVMAGTCRPKINL